MPTRLLQVQMRQGTRPHQLHALMPKVKSPSIFRTILSSLCTQRCKRNGNTLSPRLKPFLHIRSLGTGVLISHIVGIAILYTHATLHVASAANTPFSGVHNARMRREGDTCGCAMPALHLEKKGVRFSSGPSLMMMGIRCGERKPSWTRLPLWRISRPRNRS